MTEPQTMDVLKCGLWSLQTKSRVSIVANKAGMAWDLNTDFSLYYLSLIFCRRVYLHVKPFFTFSHFKVTRWSGKQLILMSAVMIRCLLLLQPFVLWVTLIRSHRHHTIVLLPLSRGYARPWRSSQNKPCLWHYREVLTSSAYTSELSALPHPNMDGNPSK